jgi:transcriptional regulator with XRE-family HTH domain
MSQSELADKILSGRSTISDVERDTRPTTTDVLERWVEACEGRLVIYESAEQTEGLRHLLHFAQKLDEEDLRRLVWIAMGMPHIPESFKSGVAATFLNVGESQGLVPPAMEKAQKKAS